MHQNSTKVRIVPEIFEIWSYIFVTCLDLGMALKVIYYFDFSFQLLLLTC